MTDTPETTRAGEALLPCEICGGPDGHFLWCPNFKAVFSPRAPAPSLALAQEALRDLYAALNSSPPDGSPEKHVGRDEVIYRLDGQKMYHAINKVRDTIKALTALPGAPAPAEARNHALHPQPDTPSPEGVRHDQ